MHTELVSKLLSSEKLKISDLMQYCYGLKKCDSEKYLLDIGGLVDNSRGKITFPWHYKEIGCSTR